MGLDLEAGHEHADKADCLEILNRTDLLLRLCQRHLELVPHGTPLLSVAQGNGGLALVGDVVLAHYQTVGAERYAVLVIAFILVEGVVLVDVLNIGYTLGRLVVGVVDLLGRTRVALGAVVVFVPVENRGLGIVIVVPAIEMIVVARRVVEGRELVLPHGLDHGRRQFRLQLGQEILVRRESILLVVGQSVKAHILQPPRATGIVEGIGERLPLGDLAPRRSGYLCRIAVDGQTVLERFHTIFENIFRHLAQVEVEVTALVVGLGLVEEGVHEPELDILDVGRLEVGIVHLAHDTAPPFLGIEQPPLFVDIVGIEVIGATFLRIERKIERLLRGRLTIVNLLVGENFAHAYLAHIGIGELVQIVFQVGGYEVGVLLREHAVDVVPRHQSPVLPVAHVVGVTGLGEEGVGRGVVGCGSQRPRVGRFEVEARLGRLKVVDIGGSLRTAGLGLVRHQLGKLGRQGQRRGGRGVDGGNLVEPVGEPQETGVVRQVHPPQGVVEHLVAHAHLLGKRFFREVHDGGSYIEILGEGVVEVETQHGLALHVEHRLVLERDADGGTRLDNALVQDGNDTHGVVDNVVGVLDQRHTAGRDHHRTAGHVHGVQTDFGARRGLVLTGHDKLVLLGDLLGDGECRVVEFLVDIFLGDGGIAYLIGQVTAEGLDDGEDDAAVRRLNGVTLDVVEDTVGILGLVGVQSVEVHHLQEGLVGDIPLGYVVDGHAGGVALILDVEAELVLLHLIGPERIDVFHHQVPDGERGGYGRALQHFQEEALVGIGHIARELAHLIDLPVVGIFISHGQHLVGI